MTVATGPNTIHWIVRMSLEYRHRVKEQPEVIGSAEFRDTQFT